MEQIHRLEGQIQRGFAAWRPAILGAVAAFAGFEGLKGLMTLANASKELLNQQDKLQRAGLTYNEVLRVQNDFYEKISKNVPTATASQFEKSFGEMRAITGPGPEGIGKAETLAQKALMVDALLGKEGEYYKLLRSAEMKGIATDDTKREQFVDKAFALITAFQGKLSAQDFQTMARRGGAAWMHTDIEKAMGPVSVLAADIGGSSAGTALMSLYQFQQGSNTLSRQQGEMLMAAGLIKPDDVTKTGFGGSRYQLKPGHTLTGGAEYSGDLPGWVKNVVSPAAHKWAQAEAARQPGKSEESLYEEFMQRIMPNRNVAKLGMMFSDPGFLQQIAKDLGLSEAILPIVEAYKNFASKNPVGVEAAYNAQWKSMMEAIGSPLMQAAIPVMTAVTDTFNQLGNLANQNPETIREIGIALAGAFTGLAAAGIVTVAAALAAMVGPAAALAGSLTVIATALAVLSPSAFQGLVDALKAFYHFDIGGVYGGIQQFQIELAHSIIDALGRVAAEVSAWISKKFTFSLPRLEAPSPGPGQDPFIMPQSFVPRGNPGALLHQANWSPGSSGGSVNVHNQITLDGQPIAQSINQYMLADLEHPRQSPYFDGRDAYTPPNWQPSAT
jgi:hypothetical protein